MRELAAGPPVPGTGPAAPQGDGLPSGCGLGASAPDAHVAEGVRTRPAVAVEIDARLRAETAAQEAGGGASCSLAFRCLLWETGRLEGAASAACWPLPSAAVEVADLG